MMTKIIGEYGINGGSTVYVIAVTRPGTAAEVRKLWRELDHVGGSPDESLVLRRLNQLGAILAQGNP
jgi:hypothetical protein